MVSALKWFTTYTVSRIALNITLCFLWCFLGSVPRPFLCGLAAWEEVIFQNGIGHETSSFLNLTLTDLEESWMQKSETSISDVCASEMKTESTATSESKDYVGSSSDNYW